MKDTFHMAGDIVLGYCLRDLLGISDLPPWLLTVLHRARCDPTGETLGQLPYGVRNYGMKGMQSACVVPLACLAFCSRASG